MNRIYKMAAGAAMAVSAATLLVMVEARVGAPQRAAVNYCLSYGEGGTTAVSPARRSARRRLRSDGRVLPHVYGKEGETLQW